MAKKTETKSVLFPRKLLAPVAKILTDELKELKKRRKDVAGEDPFNDPDRVTDNAIDTDADEQFGHDRSVAIKEQLDRKIIQTRRALSRIKLGTYGICTSCGNMIDTDRLMIYPEATQCVKCSKKKEKKKNS